MAINPDQVKLYESQRLTDEDDGGGRATGNEIIDGTINNLFNDISRLDRTLGDVALRKAFVGVATNNQDTYLGAHAIIVEPPADSNVHVVLFDAGSESDERASAQNRIESYVVKGASASWELIGSQYENQRQIVGVQRLEASIPSVGDVFLLDDNLGGVEQYVRVTEVEATDTVFTYQNGSTFTDFNRNRLVLSISAPLVATFPGGQVTPTGADGINNTEVFTTEVADASRYWGVKRSSDAVAIGDVSVKVDSIYANLVPSAQSEQPLSDQPLGLVKRAVREASSADYVYSNNFSFIYLTTTTIQAYITRSAVRGTVQLNIAGSVYTDDGSGVLVRSTGSLGFSTLDIDYESGLIAGARDSGSSTAGSTLTGTLSFRPGAPFSGKAGSLAFAVNISNRGYNYNESFAATKPRPGTMLVSYMVLGKWYEIRDPGNGILEGSGSGSVNFATGTTSITLLALPDVDTDILYSYLMDIDSEVDAHDGFIAATIPEIRLTLQPGIDPGGLTVTYTAGAATKTITDDGVGGLTGDGAGEVNYALGEVTILPDVLHDDGTDFDVTYDAVAPSSIGVSANASTGIVSGTLAGAPLKPGSVSIGGVVSSPTGYPGSAAQSVKYVRDDGVGGFIGGTGTINYSTGVYSVEFLAEITVGFVSISNGGPNPGVSAPSYQDIRQAAQSAITAWYQKTTDVAGAETSSEIPNEVSLVLIASGDDAIVPNSVLFDFAGETYFDRDGIIYKDFDTTTGAGTSVGIIDYNSRTATLDTWLGGSAPGLTLHAALTVGLNSLVSRISFRTPGAPLRPQSMQITVTDKDGNLISEQAAVDGTITGASVSGYVNVETGVVNLWFTTNDADVTNASDVQVFSDSGRYNAVLYSFLPLDAELIGLDPVRLPSDGRVPIYRAGDVVVISHTAETSGGNPAAGSAVALARDHQAGFEIFGANGFVLKSDQYVANKLTGVITFADPLTLEDAAANILTTPLLIKDRVEHMSVINDVQINGELSFISPSGHVFPATESVVSSALVWGDIASRYFNFFTQKTWFGDFVDDRVGDDTTANFNDIDNPIEIANNGAVTENWVIQFTSSTSFNVIGENLGVIGTGSTSVDIIPTNPNTGNPYFIMRSAGWGGGWAAGNCVRFDTDGCLAPVWIARTVLSGAAEEDDDKFVFQVRGDAD
jgi:hypothetical protein